MRNASFPCNMLLIIPCYLNHREAVALDCLGTSAYSLDLFGIGVYPFAEAGAAADNVFSGPA